MQDKLKLFDHLPDGHLAVPVNDLCAAPLIQPGDIAVVDLESTWLENGGLYLRRFIRTDQTSTCSIWEARHTTFNSGSGKMEGWVFLKHKAPKSIVDRDNVPRDFRSLPSADGPFEFSGPRCEKTRDGIVGRVVGLIFGLEGHARYCAARGAGNRVTPPLNPSQIHSRGNSVAGSVITPATHALVPL